MWHKRRLRGPASRPTGGHPRRCPIESEQKTFVITSGQTRKEVLGRIAAVAAAKDLSESTGRPIGLERHDGRVKMQFQRGALLTYRFETDR